MRAAPVAVVVFDLGGVVVRIARTWRGRATAAGLPLREIERCEAALTACWDGVMALQRGEIRTDDLATAVCRAAGDVYTAEEVTAALNAQLLGPFAGVFDVVQRLNVPHAIFSNTSADHWETLKDYPTVKLAKWRIASFQIGVVKPDPESYEAVEAAIGQPSERLLFFDDSQQNVDSARACGWQAERIDPFGDVAAQLAHHLTAAGVLRDAR